MDFSATFQGETETLADWKKMDETAVRMGISPVWETCKTRVHNVVATKLWFGRRKGAGDLPEFEKREET